MRLTALLLGATVVMTAGCSPDPLTLQERLHIANAMVRDLQLELLSRDRRIAELAGGETSTLPQKGPDNLNSGRLARDDPFRAVKISFSRVTGGLDLDGKPGDEGVRVVLLPEDAEGDVVKRAGTVEIDLFDLALVGGNQRIGHWNFTVDQVAHEWVGGFGVDSYSFELKWPGDRLPQHRELTVSARFTTLDGRKLSAQKAIKVQLPGD